MPDFRATESGLIVAVPEEETERAATKQRLLDTLSLLEEVHQESPSNGLVIPNVAAAAFHCVWTALGGAQQ